MKTVRQKCPRCGQVAEFEILLDWPVKGAHPAMYPTRHLDAKGKRCPPRGPRPVYPHYPEKDL